MNKTAAEGLALVTDLRRELSSVKEVDIVVCPPFTALSDVSRAILDSNLRLGAQNMSEQGMGAFTGEIAASMLKEFSVGYVILGHSERRQFQKETDALVAKKAAVAHAASPRSHRSHLGSVARQAEEARIATDFGAGANTSILSFNILPTTRLGRHRHLHSAATLALERR